MGSPPLSPLVGVLVVGGYGLAAWALSWWLARGARHSKADFLVAGRRVGQWPAALSIAATWIWAPALFLAAEKAYTQGVPGVFWFVVPNVACLLLFAPFARLLRQRLPEGVTLSEYMGQRHSRRVQGLYLVQMSGLAACSFAVQLLAGGKIVAWLTGLPYLGVAVALAAIALVYSLFAGLRASIVTDLAQMALILTVIALVVPWSVVRAGGVGVLAAGLGGVSGELRSVLGTNGLAVAWSFGIPVTIGLLSGPFGDQSFWQRAFAIRAPEVGRAFVHAAWIFALVPLSLAVLGFLAAGAGWQLADPALANMETVARVLPSWVMLPMLIMLLSGLVSTLDSNLCAISALCGHDLTGGAAERVLPVSRWSMLALAAVAVAIAAIPGMRILYLFLFYGTLRASTLLPTILTLLLRSLPEHGVFAGILLAITCGLPVFAWGNFTGRTTWTVVGSLATVLLPAATIALTAGAVGKRGITGEGKRGAPP